MNLNQYLKGQLFIAMSNTYRDLLEPEMLASTISTAVDQALQCTNPIQFNLTPDPRPPKGSWAPGNYLNVCISCRSQFVGDKRSSSCANCAYKTN